MKNCLVSVAIVGLAIPAFADNLSTGIAIWTVLEQSGPNNGKTGTAQIVTPASGDSGFPNWTPNTASSSWVAFDPNDAFGNGNGTYSTTFTLNSADLSTATISGAWTLDDVGVLELNGHLIGSLPDGSWTSLHSFSIPAGSADFVLGTNTLSMVINGTDQFIEGVDLQGTLSRVSAVPEPSGILLLVTTCGIVFATLRRRKTA
jgi:Beta-galactosidase jelly roll domain